MKKNLIIFFVVVGVLAVIGVLCYTYLEIVDAVRWEDPSREARNNPYLALERWLSGRGIPVRTLSDAAVDTVLEAPEKTVFISASCFDWTEESEESYRLTSWVKAGGDLVISIDTYSADWRLSEYLETLGVAEYDEYAEENAGEDAEENADDELPAGEPPDESLLVDRDTLPSLDYGTEFVVTGKRGDVDKISVIRSYRYHSSGTVRFTDDSAGRALLVRLEMGSGSITITGDAYFLRNGALREEPNANLAGALFLENPAETGVLFIRGGRMEKHLFGSLAEKGNTTAIFVSAAALVVIGFWMVIPLFGRAKPVSALPGKPLRERFLTEGRFLFTYNGLDKYLSAYEAELERRTRDITGADSAAAEKQPEAAEKRLSLRQFMKRQKRYMEELGKGPLH
ncbi:MAG: DUF4350 domain-containing protein [Treponema sp.]|jgi:hypothetical protein|nr:DUF4350 domain-containing protein [Treponema sp.]